MPRTLVIPVLWQKLHLFCHDFIYNLLHTCEINTLALIEYFLLWLAKYTKNNTESIFPSSQKYFQIFFFNVNLF